jgi:hypothetical protein
MALTELTIKNLKPKDKLYRVADRGGLTLEISPSGSKLWRWSYYHLGKYPVVSLAETRNNDYNFTRR